MQSGSTIRVSAPGKLFLIGEYAVLENAPAILTAVDRRAWVEIEPSSDTYWRLSAPNLGIDTLVLDTDGRPPADRDDDLYDRLRVFDAVRASVIDYLGGSLPALSIRIDTESFARDGHKLGLGSSAAVAAALTRALLAVADRRPELAELAGLAITAHRLAQNGTGSGGDVATSVYGGLIGYTRDQAPQPLAWPADLTGATVVTGQGARTTDLVDRVYAYRDRAPEAFEHDIARLAEIARHAAAGLDNAAGFLRLTQDYFDALIALDRHAEAGIVSPRHYELHAMAARYGAVFKSSGAGGGDVGLLFAHRDSESASLRAAFDQAHAEIIDLSLGAEGVRVESAPPPSSDRRRSGRV